MAWLIVTPARNEAGRIPKLAASLAAQQRGLISAWVVVDDGSTDGTGDLVRQMSLPFPAVVERRENSGGLSGASEFSAFTWGADIGLALDADATRVMKCDADLVLAPNYLGHLDGETAELVGGVIAGERERRDFVRGPLKAYTPTAYAEIRALPAALGWDVLDEVVIKECGGRCVVVPSAVASVTRRTGSSEGLLRGRWRGGVVSRWTGYDPLYFALRLLRYTTRRPVILGAGWMLAGYLTAGRGPWPAEVRRAHRRQQRQRLKALLRSRGTALRELYRA